MRQRPWLVAILIGVGMPVAPPLLAQNLNIDLGAHFGAPSNTYGAAANQAGTWNTLGLGATPSLLGLGEAATSVSATVTAYTDEGWSNTCTGDTQALMDDNIFTFGTWTVALTGLSNGTYTLFLYEPTNPEVVTGNMTVNGAAVAGITGHGCTLTAGDTYTTTQVTVTNANLTITGGSAGTPWGIAGLAGLQLQMAEVIPTYVVWVPVASHNPGKNNSQWRSDLGLLNPGAVTANVQIKFYGSGGVVSSTTYVAPKTQSILVDVVNQIPASNSGALEILSDQPLKVTARTYNQVASDADCYAGGTQGQDYPAVVSSDGLSAGQSAYLAGLSENPSTRCNIGVVNTGTGSATVLVELFNGDGNKFTDYPVSLNAGDWKQETEPFLKYAGQTAMDRGYAKITVQTGSGVFGFASVVDHTTNDPTTVAMQR